MKKLTIIAVCLLTFAACTKKSSSTSSSTTLNSTETSLLGTWYLQSMYGNVAYYSGNTPVYSSGTTTGYSNAFYITFMSNYWPPGTTTAGLENTYSWVPVLGATMNPTTTPNAGNDSWYYNTTTNYLVIGAWQCSMSLSGSSLVITYASSGDTSISTFHK